MLISLRVLIRLAAKELHSSSNINIHQNKVERFLSVSLRKKMGIGVWVENTLRTPGIYQWFPNPLGLPNLTELTSINIFKLSILYNKRSKRFNNGPYNIIIYRPIYQVLKKNPPPLHSLTPIFLYQGGGFFVR